MAATLQQVQPWAANEKFDVLIKNAAEFADADALPTALMSLGASGMPRRGVFLPKPFLKQDLLLKQDLREVILSVLGFGTLTRWPAKFMASDVALFPSAV